MQTIRSKQNSHEKVEKEKRECDSESLETRPLVTFLKDAVVVGAVLLVRVFFFGLAFSEGQFALD